MNLMMGYGVRSYGIEVLGTLALQVDQVLVISLLSPSAMGSYVVVLSLSRMLNLFQNSVVMVLFPRAAGRSAGEVVALTGSSVRISGLITALSGISYV
jgi:O-antigen/teichoic acid export membrane protein